MFLRQVFKRFFAAKKSFYRLIEKCTIAFCKFTSHNRYKARYLILDREKLRYYEQVQGCEAGAKPKGVLLVDNMVRAYPTDGQTKGEPTFAIELHTKGTPPRIWMGKNGGNRQRCGTRAPK